MTQTRKIFFTANNWFGNENVALNRQFSSVEEMNKSMVALWNSVVRDSDIVYCLGGFSDKLAGVVAPIIVSLSGTIIFLVPPHQNLGWMPIVSATNEKCRFVESVISRIFNLDGQETTVVMSYYRLTFWPGKNLGSWHLYACEGDETLSGNAMNVSVDDFAEISGQYRPISGEEIAEYIWRKEHNETRKFNQFALRDGHRRFSKRD